MRPRRFSTHESPSFKVRCSARTEFVIRKSRSSFCEPVNMRLVHDKCVLWSGSMRRSAKAEPGTRTGNPSDSTRLDKAGSRIQPQTLKTTRLPPMMLALPYCALMSCGFFRSVWAPPAMHRAKLVNRGIFWINSCNLHRDKMFMAMNPRSHDRISKASNFLADSKINVDPPTTSRIPALARRERFLGLSLDRERLVQNGV